MKFAVSLSILVQSKSTSQVDWLRIISSNKRHSYNNGHYTAVRSESNGCYIFDDARVMKITPAQWERGYGTIFFLERVEDTGTLARGI